MKRVALLITFLFLGLVGVSIAQQGGNTQAVPTVTSDPTGNACSANQIVIFTPSGALFTCDDTGRFAAVGGGGGACDPTKEVCLATAHLAQADILALPQTGFILHAGVTGKVLVPVWARIHYNFVTTPYTFLGQNATGDAYIWNGNWAYVSLYDQGFFSLPTLTESNADVVLPVSYGFNGSTQRWPISGATGVTGSPLVFCTYGHCNTTALGQSNSGGSGAIRSYSLAGGTSYIAGQSLNVDPNGQGTATLIIDTVNGGGVPLTSHLSVIGTMYGEDSTTALFPDAGCKTVTIGGNAGLDYMVGDMIFAIANGSGPPFGCQVNVTSVNGMGAVTGISAPATAGTGYSIGNDQSSQGGSGNGALTLNITALTGTGLSLTVNSVQNFSGGDGTIDVIYGYSEH